MRRAVSFALAAMVLCAIVAVVVSHVDTTQIMSALGSSFTSAADRSHGFLRRPLTSIHLDYSLIDRVRVLAIEHVHTAHNSTKKALVPCVDAGRHFVRQAMARYRFLRSADAPRLPRMSIESVAYCHQPGPYPRYGSHPQFASYPWDIAYCPLPQDPFDNPSTLCLMMATSIITAIVLIAIISAISTSSAILSSMRFPWLCVKALTDRLPPKPKKNMNLKALLVRLASKLGTTWGTICEEFIHSLLNLVASGFALLAILSTSLLLFIGNIAVAAHNLDIGLKIRGPPPPPPPPEVVTRYVADPEAPKLKMENQKLRKEAKDNDDENLKLRTRLGNLSYQLEGEKGRGDDLEKERNLAVEQKKESDAESAEQLRDQRDTIRSLLASRRAIREELAALQTTHASCQDRLNAKNGDCEYYMQRILALEDDLEAIRTQLDGLLASQKEDSEPFRKQLQERDKTIQAQENTIQDLRDQLEKQAEHHASQAKSESAYTKRAFDREAQKMRKACQKKSADHKTAEAKLKAETEAHKAAEQKLQAEKATRTQAEAALEAVKNDRKAADATVSKLNAEVALLKLKLSNGRSLYVDHGTQTSGPPTILPPPHLRPTLPAKPPKSSGGNGAAVPDKNMFKMPSSFNFGESSAEGIFGVNFSHKPETPADPSPSQPAPSVEQPEQPEPPESPL